MSTQERSMKKQESIEKVATLRKCKNTEFVSNGAPRAHFEHSGVLHGAKLHARHDGNSEIIS